MLKRTTPWLSSTFLLASLVLQPPAPARATTFEQLHAMVRADSGEEEALVDDLVIVAAKILRDAGKGGDAETLIDNFSEYSERATNDVFCRNTGDCDPRSRLFLSLVLEGYRDVIQSFPDAAARDLEVELTFMIRVREELNIALPRAFVEIAKAGAIRSTALAMRGERKELEESDYDPAVAVEAAREFVRTALAALGPQRVEVPLQQIADFTPQWGGKTVIATGTVSHAATITAYGSAYQHLYFEGAGDQFVVCFGDTLRALKDFPAELRALKDPSELVGRTVVIGGYVDGPVACLDQDRGTVAAMELRQSAQIRLIEGGSRTAAREPD